MKNKEILDLSNSLSSIKNLKGAKFNYAIARNINILKPLVESLKSAISPRDNFEEYEKLRIALCEKHAKKDDKGNAETAIMNPMTGQTKYVLEDEAAFEKELKKLDEKHKETLEEREKQEEEFKKLLEEETPVELHKISLSEIPEDITTVQMNGIYQIIE